MQRFPLSTHLIHILRPGPVGFAIGMAIGAAWYLSIDFEPAIWALLICLSLSLVSLGAGIRQGLPAWCIGGLIILFGATVGASSGRFATLRAQTITMADEVGPIRLEGWVQAALPGENGTRLLLRVHAIDGVASSQTPRFVRVTHRLSLQTEPGRFVQCWTVLRPPPAPILTNDYSFDRQAWYAGLGAVGYVQGRCRGGVVGPPSGLRDSASHWVSIQRRQLAHYVRKAAGERAGGFAAALTSGDRSFMSFDDQEALRGAGLAHLLAISGLHMGIVGGIVFLLVWRCLGLVEPISLRVSVKKPAAAVALLACLTYLIISGASVSTQRAFIMAAVLFGAVLIDRTALSLRSLSIAMILILIIAPWSVLTPGFQMSFAATGALVASYERWQRRVRETGMVRRRKIVFWVQSLFVTSTVSSFATMPFALYHFDRVAGLGLVANLLAMPIVSLISAPSATAALVLVPFGLDHWALRVFGWSLEGVLLVAHHFSSLWPDRTLTLPPMPSVSLMLLSGGLIVFCLSRTAQIAWSGAVALALTAMVVWAGSGQPKLHWAPSGDVFLEQANGKVERFKVTKGDGLAPLRFKDIPVRQTCRSEVPCQFSFEGMTWRFNPATGELDPAGGTDQGQPALSWEKTQAQNGLTVGVSEGMFKIEARPKCGRRPWRPC
ncbi:MAG: ComEC/Rec2 family competence protein [Pseudomonadota bacterium]